jgi:hypothetical protein
MSRRQRTNWTTMSMCFLLSKECISLPLRWLQGLRQNSLSLWTKENMPTKTHALKEPSNSNQANS